MQKRTARILFGGGVGAGVGAIVGLGLADLYDAVLMPANRASTPTSPGILQVGRFWHRYLHTQSYWPWNIVRLLVHHPHSLWVPAVLAMGFGSLLAYKAKGSAFTTWGGPPQAGRGQHGTAHWRPASDLHDGLYQWKPPDKNGRQPPTAPKYPGSPEHRPRSGIVVGQAGPTSLWVANGEDHVLLAGTTGAGKSRREFLPTIGLLGLEGESSFVTTDPKGELFAFAAAWLTSQGYDVVRFDLRDPRKGGQEARWNPVEAVAAALDRGDVGFASQMAWQIAHGIGAKSTKVNDEYWSSTAEAVVAGLVLAVAAGNPYRGDPDGDQEAQRLALERLLPAWRDLPLAVQLRIQEAQKGSKDAPLQIWDWPERTAAHLVSVYRSMVYGGTGGRILDIWMDLLPVGHPARDAWATIAASSGSEKTRAGILSSALADLRLLSEPDLQWLLSDQGMPLDQPGQKKTAVFLVVPDDDSTRYPLATLYLSQMIAALTRFADSQPSGRLPIPVLFLLDEFGNFPPLPNLSQIVTAARSRGMRLMLGLQSFSQLKHAYGPDTAQTVRENLGTWIYLLTSSPDMAEEISKRLGTYTTRTESTNYPKPALLSTSTFGLRNSSQGESLTSRPLMTADEIMRWPDNQALILQQRKPGARLPLPDLSVWQQAGLFTALSRSTEPMVIPDGGRSPDIWWPMARAANDAPPAPAASAGAEITLREEVSLMAEAELLTLSPADEALFVMGQDLDLLD